MQDINFLKTFDVKAVLVDAEWFQVYDNANQFTEQYVGSGIYWNYFYNVWKTVSSSPFSNAIVFVDNSADTTLPNNITVEVTGKTISEEATVITLEPQTDNATIESRNYQFIQTEACVEGLVAVHKYGAIIFPANSEAQYIEFKIGNVVYKSATTVGTTVSVGDTVTFTREDFIDNTLSALSITGVTLAPVFDTDTVTYTGSTSTGTGTLTATATDSGAIKIVKFNGSAVSGDSLTFTKGAGNVLEIAVSGVSEGAVSTKTYKVTITYTA